MFVTPIEWGNHGYEMEAFGKENRGDMMLNILREHGVRLSAPPLHQRAVPTCRPRNQEAQGRHIDVLGAKHCMHQGVGIVTDSHRFVGSDHDIVVQKVAFKDSGVKVQRRPFTRPPRVVGKLNVPEVLDQ